MNRYALEGNEASVFSRFHFRPHFYQHASFRVVEQLDANSETGTVYSDMDAPGPYVRMDSQVVGNLISLTSTLYCIVQVGKYPFRRSKKSILAASHVSREEEKKRRVNNELSRHFGAMQLQHSLYVSRLHEFKPSLITIAPRHH